MKFSIKTTEFELRNAGVPDDYHGIPYLIITTEIGKLRVNSKNAPWHVKAMQPIADELIAKARREPKNPKAYDLIRWADFYDACASRAGVNTRLKTIVRLVMPLSDFNYDEPSQGPSFLIWGTANTSEPGSKVSVSGKEYKSLIPERFSVEMIAHLTKLREQVAAQEASVVKPTQTYKPRPAPAPKRKDFGKQVPVAILPWGPSATPLVNEPIGESEIES